MKSYQEIPKEDAFEKDDGVCGCCGSRLVHTVQGDAVCPDCGMGEI